MYELADDELFYLSVFFLSPGSNPMAFLFSDKVLNEIGSMVEPTALYARPISA
jgi:hypothetical protein